MTIDLTYLRERMDQETLFELLTGCDFIAESFKNTIAPVRAHLVNDLVERLRTDKRLIPEGTKIFIEVLLSFVNNSEEVTLLMNEIDKAHKHSP